MKTSQRRIALLTGASLAALGLATPAFAAPHDILLPGGDLTNAGTNTNDPLIDLCTVAAATPDCFFGVIDTGVATANATVASTASGRIYQHDTAATVTLDMNVAAAETAEVGAIAVATGGANGVANAKMTTNAIEQFANATAGDASANIDIAAGGRLLVDMVAIAEGSTFASANASNSTAAIQQHALVGAAGVGTAAVSIHNAGSLTVLASASAVASLGRATADASIDEGISQTATNLGSGNASALIDNLGTLDIKARAFASGNTATATATVSDAIDQFVLAADGNASAQINNDALGLINISAAAVAIADVGNASASASNDSAIDIQADATGVGDAAATVSNLGELDITAKAFASGAVNATASASVSNGFDISATAADGNAVAKLVNGGAVNIAASATALAAVTADASATVSDAIQISATANLGGNATAALTNLAGGTIDIGMKAVAAAGNVAFASATLETGISMTASASSGGIASAILDNEGSLLVHATAGAIANDASAVASMSDVITMEATVVSGGTAAVHLTNGAAGVIDIGALAQASGGVSVDAFASVSNAITMSADAEVSGNATASIVNDGSIKIHATASALATGDASATASATSNISEYAFADDGNATVKLTGAGTIDVGAKALAISTTSSAYAHAFVESALYQRAYVNGSGSALVSDNLGDFNAHATASASGSQALATATLESGIDAQASVTQTGDATVNIVNSGDLVLKAMANATSTRNSATAYAYLSEQGIREAAFAADGNASVSLVNNGTITLEADAHAVANTFAHASATVSSGIVQIADATGGDAYAEIINAPALSIMANATATGNSATAYASVSTGISQSVNALGGNATALLSNSDPLTISANALANADVNFAHATATIDLGVTQNVSATGTTGGAAGLGFAANATINNGTAGVMDVSAHATANGITLATASANVDTAFKQDVVSKSGAAHALFANDGVVTVLASANANATGSAFATATAADFLFQTAVGATGASVLLSNAGTIDGGAVANAVADGFASASASFTGVHQDAPSGTAAVVNSTGASMNFHATAVASASTATAHAAVFGVTQVAALDSFHNDGDFRALASASAVGSAGTANAFASGVSAANVFGATTASIDFVNGADANFSVTAIAAAPTGAGATAIGLNVSQSGPSSAVATHSEVLAGSIVNSGNFHVLASAAGGGSFTTPTVGGGTTTLDNSHATATGIRMSSGTNNLTVTNTGTLSVDAVTAAGTLGSANATGILATDNGTGIAAAPGSQLTIINDGGDIIVRESNDGGATWHRGMAIDVATAPNPTVINLLGAAGDGYIYGNIDDQAGDVINVESGTTYFDGIINPEYVPVHTGVVGFTTADLDSSIAGDGDLVISNGGNLILADPRLTGDSTIYDGPAYAIVDNFTVATDGTITFELQPDASGTQPVGTYPQVYANHASLNGTLVADITPANGLFFNSYFWDNVIDAHTRTGDDFQGAGQCVIDGAYAGSLFVDLACEEDANDNIDLRLTRNPFNAIPGLNINGQSVADGIECIYDPTLTGGIHDLLATLFTFTDPVAYNVALNNLAGEGYANYLQSFPSLGVHYNDLLDHATNCEVPALAGSILECRASSPLHLWGQLDYQWRKADGDLEAGTAKAKRFTGLIGLDANVGGAGIVGASVGYGSNNTRTGRFDEKVDGSGWNVGLYGAYDPGTFYVKAMSSYSWMDGDSSRRINIVAPGGTFAGTTNGDPDVTMWTFGLHGGYRIGMGGNSVVTPYLDYDYVNAKLKSFTETGLDGANLTVEGGRSKHSFLTGGVKWATQLGGVVPELNLGYRYRFGRKVSAFDAAFIGDTACDFEVISAAQKKGTFLAGLSVGGKVGPVDLRIGYEGEYNADITSHSGNFKIVIPLGGHAAPPPPPPPAAAPPPPPPPAPEAAPPPPPPPPAPVERGERGQ